MEWRTYIAVLVAIALLVVGALWLAERGEGDERSEESTVGSEYEEPRSSPEPRSTMRTEAPARDSEPTSVKRAPAGTVRAEAPATHEAATESGRPDSQVEPVAVGEPSPVGDVPPPLDAGTHDADDWEDPVNQRVLGDKNWMAPVSDEENERIDEVFERTRAALHDPALSPLDRRTSIEAVREVVDTCFDDLDQRHPGIRGRLIVAWQAGATDGEGWIRNPLIKVNYRLEDPQFESCILDALPRLTYPANDGDPIRVEYPFFYDGT